MAKLLRAFTQTGQDVQNTLHVIRQPGLDHRRRTQGRGSGPENWRGGDGNGEGRAASGISVAIACRRHHGPQGRRGDGRRSTHRCRKALHAVVIRLGIPKHNAFHRKAPHLAAPFAQAHGERRKVGVARGNRKQPNALLKMQRHRIGNQRGIGGVFLQRQIGKSARAQITPHRALQPLQTRPGTIRAAHADTARIGVELRISPFNGLRVGEIVCVNQQRRLPDVVRAECVAHSASSFHGSASPLRSGFNSASPKAKLTGGVQLSLANVIVPALRGRP